MTEQNCHVAPEPIEAPEEQREQRRRDLVREEAVRLGRLAQLQDERAGADKAAAFRAGVEAYERHLSRHDYRGRK